MTNFQNDDELKRIFEGFITAEAQLLDKYLTEIDELADKTYKKSECTCQVINAAQIMMCQVSSLTNSFKIVIQHNTKKEEGHKFLPEDIKKYIQQLSGAIFLTLDMEKKYGLNDHKHDSEKGN